MIVDFLHFHKYFPTNDHKLHFMLHNIILNVEKTEICNYGGFTKAKSLTGKIH